MKGSWCEIGSLATAISDVVVCCCFDWAGHGDEDVTLPIMCVRECDGVVFFSPDSPDEVTVRVDYKWVDECVAPVSRAPVSRAPSRAPSLSRPY